MADSEFPGNLNEFQFVTAYAESTLRKPQVVADAALRALVLAGSSDRIVLVGLLAEQLVEAARRLTAVYSALSDRRYLVARTLLQPLPGADDWERMIDEVLAIAPGQLPRHLSLGDEAAEAAERFRAQPDLSFVTPLIRASEAGSAMFLLQRGPAARPYDEFWLAGVDREGTTVTAALAGDEAAAAALADLTADLSSVARGLLGAYVGARPVSSA